MAGATQASNLIHADSRPEVLKEKGTLVLFSYSRMQIAMQKRFDSGVIVSSNSPHDRFVQLTRSSQAKTGELLHPFISLFKSLQISSNLEGDWLGRGLRAFITFPSPRLLVNFAFCS